MGKINCNLEYVKYRTAATGPFHGISLNAKANDAAFILSTSGKFCASIARRLQTNCVSHLYSPGNNGRSDLSITRAVSISFSDGPRQVNLMKYKSQYHAFTDDKFIELTQFPSQEIHWYATSSR